MQTLTAPNSLQLTTFGEKSRSRLGSFGIVAFIHVLVLLALWQLGAVPAAMREAAPLMVSLLPQEQRAQPRPLESQPKAFVPDLVFIPPPQVVVAQESRPIIAAAVSKPIEIAPPAPPAPAKAEPPRFDLDYLNNPAPAYPGLAKRLGLQGKVMLRVRVSARGLAESVEVQTSCGVESLDNAAVEAVKRWRFAPAMRGEEAVEGWALVPINFKLNS